MKFNKADLPKKYGHYITDVGKVAFGGMKSYNKKMMHMGMKIAWYLQPITTELIVPSEEEIEKEALERAK